MNWEAKIISHKKESRIAVYFKKNTELITRIKKLQGVRWSQTLSVWHLPDTEEYRIRFKLQLASQSLPSDEGQLAITQFKQFLSSKRYSERTIITYSEALKSFLVFYKTKSISIIDNNDVIRYNNDFILKNGYSSSFQNQIVNAIKLFFSIVENRKIVIGDIHRPKGDKKLPNVLSKEEVLKIIDVTTNLKHKTLLALTYSSGLRISEALSMKSTDIDKVRMLIHIKNAKGKKDRYTLLSAKILLLMREYDSIYKPKEYLFEGQYGGQYSSRSAQVVLQESAQKAGIEKRYRFALHTRITRT